MTIQNSQALADRIGVGQLGTAIWNRTSYARSARSTPPKREAAARALVYLLDKVEEHTNQRPVSPDPLPKPMQVLDLLAQVPPLARRDIAGSYLAILKNPGAGRLRHRPLIELSSGDFLQSPFLQDSRFFREYDRWQLTASDEGARRVRIRIHLLESLCSTFDAYPEEQETILINLFQHAHETLKKLDNLSGNIERRTLAYSAAKDCFKIRDYPEAFRHLVAAMYRATPSGNPTSRQLANLLDHLRELLKQ